MPIGTDRVQVYKRESSDQGGDDLDNFEGYGPVPIDPTEDAIECAGVYLQEPGQRDELVAIYRHKNAIWIQDKWYPSGRPLEVLYALDGSLVLDSDGKYVWTE